jgi:hypothetical protein
MEKFQRPFRFSFAPLYLFGKADAKVKQILLQTNSYDGIF